MLSCRPLVKKGGADIEAQDDGGDTPLHEAARANEIDVIRASKPWRRERCAKQNWCNASHSRIHKEPVCKALLTGAAVNGSRSQMIGGYSPLHVAAAIGSTDCLQELVDAGASLRHSASELAYRVVLPQHLELEKMLDSDRQPQYFGTPLSASSTSSVYGANTH